MWLKPWEVVGMELKTLLGKIFSSTSPLSNILLYIVILTIYNWHDIVPFSFFILLGKINNNSNRGPTFRFVNAIEYITVGYFDEIKKQRIKEHSNEVGGSNLLVYLEITRKLWHVTTTKRGLVNSYQKPQWLIMRLIEMFPSEGDWICDLFYGTGTFVSLCWLWSWIQKSDFWLKHSFFICY